MGSGIGTGSDRDLSELRRRLSVWRRKQGGRGRRLPEDLWGEAVRLGREGDPRAVARALRLNPDSLSRRMAPATGSRAAAFVEVAAVAEPLAGGACRVEWSSTGGSRISFHFADPRGVDLIGLATGLLRAGR